jgi:hypothetical protein
MNDEDKTYISKRFNIPMEDIIWYNSGICYSRVAVKTMSSAIKIREKVNGQSANGGMLDGMRLGSISEMKDDKGNIYYDVTC